MLMQVDPQTFALNLMLILGALILLSIIFVLFVAMWTGINALIWFIQRHRKQKEFLRQTRRADGQRYPAFTEGVCEGCGRGDRKIYYPPRGKALCPTCYEESWPCGEFLARAQNDSKMECPPQTSPTDSNAPPSPGLITATT